MPALGVSVTDKQEGLAQLVVGLILAAIFLSFYFGKPWFGWLGMPTPFGIMLGDVFILAGYGVGIPVIVWRTFFPRGVDGARWHAVSMIFFALSQLPVMTGRGHPHVVAMSGIAAATVAMTCGLFIFARHHWGAR